MADVRLTATNPEDSSVVLADLVDLGVTYAIKNGVASIALISK